MSFDQALVVAHGLLRSRMRTAKVKSMTSGRHVSLNTIAGAVNAASDFPTIDWVWNLVSKASVLAVYLLNKRFVLSTAAVCPLIGITTFHFQVLKTILRLPIITALLLGLIAKIIYRMSHPKKSIKGKLCLITGAGGGLGRHLALEFAAHGAKLVLVDINTTGITDVKREVQAKLPGHEVWCFGGIEQV